MGMRIDYFLIKPVQRITKYGILAKRLKEETFKEYPDFKLLEEAEETIRSKLGFINSAVNPDDKNKQKVAVIGKDLKIENLVKAGRQYIQHSDFSRVKDLPLRVYLLSDSLVVANVTPKGKQKFITKMYLDNVWAMPSTANPKGLIVSKRLI